MWTPVINNVVVIVIGGAFMLIAGLNQTPQNISGAEIQLLGIGTTLGIVAQTVALVPSLRKVGFRWRPRFDFRRAEVSEIGRMGGWMFGYVLTTQVSFLVTAVVANLAGAKVSQADPGAGYAAYGNAWQLFQLPYAIVGISVITAMLPRMSSHAASRSFGLVRDDFSGAARLASVIVVPAALVLAVLGEPLVGGPVRLRQHLGRERPLPGRDLRRVLTRPAALHGLPAPAAGVLRDARQPHAGPDRRSRPWP